MQVGSFSPLCLKLGFLNGLVRPSKIQKCLNIQCNLPQKIKSVNPFCASEFPWIYKVLIPGKAVVHLSI